ncbi:MAG: ABC transporter permease [Planctomycetia bacterium]|nr:ABC transporter permease [Planctomycetia bacterium]
MPGQTHGSDSSDAGGLTRGLSPAADATDGSPQEPEAVARSYGAIVWRQFRKRHAAMVGLVFVWLLLTGAVFAPFIANEVPYYWVEDGETSFPVLSYLSNLEVSAIVAYFLLMASIIVVWVARRRAPSVKQLLIAAVIVWVAVSASLVIFRRGETRFPFYLERTDAASSYAFPPVAYYINPGYVGPDERIQAPSAEHLLGTGRLGDDVLMGIIYGARTAMTIGFVAVGLSLVIGVLLGALSGYLLGTMDVVLMRIVEILMCLPRLILIIILLSVAPAGVSQIWTVVLVLGLTGWTGVFRLMRAEMLRIRNEDYIIAGHALGIPRWRLLVRHAIPNGLAPILVSATFGIAGAVFLEASLSFLHLVETPSWGQMLNDGRQSLDAWWLWASSGGAIFLTVLVYNLVGEGLRDAIDPRLKISGA